MCFFYIFSDVAGDGMTIELSKLEPPETRGYILTTGQTHGQRKWPLWADIEDVVSFLSLEWFRLILKYSELERISENFRHTELIKLEVS